MASRHRYDQEVRFNGGDEDEDQDEVEIYSVSGLSKIRGPNSGRGVQASRFGAVDEDIELQLELNQSRNSTTRVKSTQQRNHELGPSAYQTAIDQRNPSGSQERAEELDEAMERLLELVGFGKLQWLMLAVCGCGMLYGSVQLGFIGYILPDIARDLCLSDASTGWLRGSVFVGVIFVSVFWGCVADLGCRRKALSVCLAISGVSTAMAACFARSHSALMVFLVTASLGTGGAISIPFAYLTEFTPRRIAHKTVCALLTFTVLGAMLTPIVTPAFASSLTDGDFAAGSPFAKWRIFCLVASLLPVVSAIFLPLILPGSPYLLAEQRKWTKTIEVLTHAYSYNRGYSHLESFKDRANGLYLLKRHSRDRQSYAPSTTLQKCTRMLYLGLKNITSIMDKKTFILATSAFAFAFGFCSWTLWLSDFITAEGLSFNASISANSTLSDETIEGTLHKHFFINASFENVSFSNIHLRGVSYTDCSFVGSSFERVLSEATSFNRCTFVNTIFKDTDFQPWQFVGSASVNSSYRGTGRGCAVDVPFAPATAYWQITFGHSGGLLGLLLSVFVTRLIDTRLLFMYGTLVTAVTIVFGFFPLTGWTAAVRQFVLQFGGFASCSALIVQVILSFPTHKRVTCLGLVLAVVTTGGLLGFIAVVVLPQVADVIVTASLLLVSVLCSCCFQRQSLE